MGWLSGLFAPKEVVEPTPVGTLDGWRSEVLGSQLPVIVNVTSPTCAPCRRLAPVLVDVATQYRNRVRVVKVDVSAEPALLRQLGVSSTPTILVFDEGEEFGRMVGFRPKGWFDEMIATEFPED